MSIGAWHLMGALWAESRPEFEFLSRPLLIRWSGTGYMQVYALSASEAILSSRVLPMAWSPVIPVYTLVFAALVSSVWGQTQSSKHSAGGISRDLLSIYEQTKTVATDADVTALARACANIIPDSRRSRPDRDYAASLLGWALNRRGEMRSERASKLVEQGNMAEAASLDQLAARDFETALEHSPDNWRTHHNFAISLAMQGDYPRAIEEFTHAIRLHSKYANAYFNRAELYYELERYAPAIEDYSRAIAMNESDPQYHNSRAHARFMLGEYPEALVDYQRASALGIDSAVYQTDLADAYHFLGQWEQAAAAYRAAIALDGKYARAYQNASWLMSTCPDLKFRNRELAISTARKAIDLSAEASARGLETLAAAVAATGDFREAASLQREAIGLAAPEEKDEMSQRLDLYAAGKAYTQPRPMTSAGPSGLLPAELQTARSADSAPR